MGSEVKTWLKFVAANVRQLRLKLGQTQERLAELAGIDPRYVQDVERARTNFSFGIFIALASALGVPPSRLLRPARMTPAKAGRPPTAGPRPRKAEGRAPSKKRPPS